MKTGLYCYTIREMNTKKPNLFSRLFQDTTNYERPFFLFLTLVMVGIYVAALVSSPALHPAWKIALFTCLMAVHIGLYWLSPWVLQHVRWLGLYFLVQILLAFSIGMMSRAIGVAFGLYPGLIGLLVGVPIRRLWKVSSILLILAVSAVNFTLLVGMERIAWWLLVTFPVVVFITLYVNMYLRQSEARERAQALLKDLEAANRQLTEYTARVEDLTIASERQRMARELHDTLSQGLAGLILQLEAADAHLAGNRPERARGILEQSMEKARQTLAEARLAIDDLRHATPRSLEQAVWQEIEHFTDSTGLACTAEIALPAHIPEQVSETALRLSVEGLTNVARHAHASQVSLRIAGVEAEAGPALELEICDDGVGFDPESVEAGHYGLLGMRERVRLAGGRLELRTSPGKGTCLLVRFPLQQEAQASAHPVGAPAAMPDNNAQVVAEDPPASASHPKKVRSKA